MDYLKDIKQLLPIDQQFPDKDYPVGEVLEYKVGADDRTAVDRMTSEEKKELDVSYFDIHNDFRRAAGECTRSRRDRITAPLYFSPSGVFQSRTARQGCGPSLGSSRE